MNRKKNISFVKLILQRNHKDFWNDAPWTHQSGDVWPECTWTPKLSRVRCEATCVPQTQQQVCNMTAEEEMTQAAAMTQSPGLSIRSHPGDAFTKLHTAWWCSKRVPVLNGPAVQNFHQVITDPEIQQLLFSVCLRWENVWMFVSCDGLFLLVFIAPSSFRGAFTVCPSVGEGNSLHTMWQFLFPLIYRFTVGTETARLRDDSRQSVWFQRVVKAGDSFSSQSSRQPRDSSGRHSHSFLKLLFALVQSAAVLSYDVSECLLCEVRKHRRGDLCADKRCQTVFRYYFDMNEAWDSLLTSETQSVCSTLDSLCVLAARVLKEDHKLSLFPYRLNFL